MENKLEEKFKEKLKNKFPKIKIKGIYTNSSTKTAFICDEDFYEWDSTPSNVLQHGCPVCSGHRINDYKFKENVKSRNKKIEILGTFINWETLILCRCLLCNDEFYANPHSIYNGSGHFACIGKYITAGKTKTTEWFINQLEERFPNEYDVLGEYTKKKEKIKIRHKKCGYEWEPTPDGLLSKRNSSPPCPNCSGLTKIDYQTFVNRLSEYDSTIEFVGEFVNMRIKSDFKCKTCGCVWNTAPEAIFSNNSGCPICHGGTNLVIKGINDMWTTNPELAKMLADPNDGYIYSEGMSKKVLWKCVDCGKILPKRSISKVKDRGYFCPVCSSAKSLPNRIMYNLLTQINIDFEDEKFFDWCKFEVNNKKAYGIYDFFILDKKILIEMDGRLHSESGGFKGRNLEEQKFRDLEKDRLAIENGFEIIRIDCYKSEVLYIKNSIVNSKMSEYFDFSMINWNKCFYDSASSILIKVCNEYNNGNTLKFISQKYHKDVSTIMKFLDYGATINLCDYKHNGNKVKIICLNDGLIHESINETSRYYNISVGKLRNQIISTYEDFLNDNKLYFMRYDDYINEKEIA